MAIESSPMGSNRRFRPVKRSSPRRIAEPLAPQWLASAAAATAFSALWCPGTGSFTSHTTRSWRQIEKLWNPRRAAEIGGMPGGRSREAKRFDRGRRTGNRSQRRGAIGMREHEPVGRHTLGELGEGELELFE